MLIGLNEHHSLFITLLALNGIAVQLETLLKSFHSLVILLHHLMGSTLSCPGTDEVFINSECLVSVFESLNRVHQFEVACGSVRVAGFVLGVTTETFIEFLDSSRESSLLEQGSALILVYNSNFRINVSGSSLFLLILLATALSILDSARVILNESLAVHFNGFIVFTILLKGRSLTRHQFGQLGKVVGAGLCVVNTFVALSDSIIELFLLNQNSSNVTVDKGFIRVELIGLVVFSESLVKLFGFVKFIA